MADLKKYNPILKCKQGDLWALKNLKPGSKGVVVPVIELVPPTSKKTIDEQLIGAAKDIKKSWQKRPCYVDALWLADYETNSVNSHPLTKFFSAARNEKINVIPVTGARRSQVYQNSVARIIKKDKKGVLLRIKQEDDVKVQTIAINNLLQLFGIPKTEASLMLDYGHIASLQTNLLAQTIKSRIAAISNVNSWKEFSVALGSFPENVSSLNKGQWNDLARKDWESWNSLITNHSPKRTPIYSDFTIGDPNLPYDGRANITVNLRYSTQKKYFIWRGYWTKTHSLGFKQIYSVCTDLVSRSEYAGAQFSLGDQEISMRSANQGSTGNAASWRKWATNHYIELVVNQIANHPDL